MFWVLDPVVDVVQRPVIDFARRQHRVLFAAHDLVRQGLDLVVDQDISRRLQIRAEVSTFLFRQGPGGGGVARFANFGPPQGKSLATGDLLFLGWTRRRRIQPFSSVVTHGHHYACGEPILAGAEWPAGTARSVPATWPQHAQPLSSPTGE